MAGALVGIHKIQPTQIDTLTVNPNPVHHFAGPSLAPTKVGAYLTMGAITGASAEERAMILAGADAANKVMASDCYKKILLAGAFTETNGLSNQQILDKQLKGPVTVNVEMFTGSFKQNYWSKTIGYEYMDEPQNLYMNRHFVDTAFMVGDNIMHEGEGHSQGFWHNGVKSTSVPYGENDIFEECATQLGIK